MSMTTCYKQLQTEVFYFYIKRLSFSTFLEFGPQIRCPWNWYTDLKLAQDQPLVMLRIPLSVRTKYGMRMDTKLDNFLHLHENKKIWHEICVSPFFLWGLQWFYFCWHIFSNLRPYLVQYWNVVAFFILNF